MGNVWRFTRLSWKYGGGAFYIPFALSMFLIGLPLLVLEFALGTSLPLWRHSLLQCDASSSSGDRFGVCGPAS